MSRHLRSRLITSLMAAAVLAAVPALAASAEPAAEPDGTGTILYFNDAHEIGPVLTGDQDRGGVARLSTAIDTVRAEEGVAPSVVFGGDLAGGTIFGGLYKGFPMVEAFNEIGLDVANLGQHDFDFGVANARKLIAASEFPWITSNLTEPDGTPFLPGKTWRVDTVGDLSVGYIGLTNAMNSTSVGGEVLERDHIEAATEAVADMRASADPDIIVAVAQVPQTVGKALVDEVPGIGLVLLEEMAEYDSVIIEHKGVVLAAPEGNMGSLVRLDLTLGADNEVSVTPTVIKVDHTVKPDSELRALEERYEAEMKENLSEHLATVETPLLNPEHATRRIETLLGNFVADAYRDYHSADIGWANGGGIRAEAPGPDFTLRDAYALAPFDNKVMHVKVRGSGLRQALEEGVLRVADLGGGFPQVSGMAFAYDPEAPAGERVGEVTVAGEPLDEDASYTVAVTNYVVNGGDAITGFADATILVPAGQAPADAEAIAAHARSLTVINLELEGRIVIGDKLPVTEPEPPVTKPGLPVTKPGLPVTKPGLPVTKPGLPKTGA